MATVQHKNAENAKQCPLHQMCGRFLATLSTFHTPALDEEAFKGHYLAPEQHHCFCAACEPNLSDVLDSGGTYELPKGWCGFGLKLSPRADALNIWDWNVTFHGCKAANVPSILAEGSLLMPGDEMMDGTKLRNAHTGGGKSRLHIYTSPSIFYSELDIYCEPSNFEGHNIRVVLQCRQNPTSLSTYGETIGWENQFGDVPISPNFKNDAIECMTDARGSVIPYRILIKVNSDTRLYQELRFKAFDAVKIGDHCRVVNDASLARLAQSPSKQQFLGCVGIVDSIEQADSRPVRITFPGLGGKTEAFEKGQIDAAAHLDATCVGQQLRVVKDRKLVEQACKKVKFVEGMAKYLGSSGEVSRKDKGKVELRFADGSTYWWGPEALEFHLHSSGLLLREELQRGADGPGAQAVRWEYREGGAWHSFDSTASAAVEAAMDRDEGWAEARFVNPRTKSSVTYRYDLVRLKQTNTATMFQRDIRRVPPLAEPQWEFEEFGKWTAFDQAAAMQVEGALQASPPRTCTHSDFLNPRTKKVTKYRYNLKQRVQINTVSGYKRDIRRRPAYDVSVFQGSDSDEEEEEEGLMCAICCEEGKISRKDEQELPTKTCKHSKRSVCDACLAKHVKEEVNGKGNVTEIRCPEAGCGAAMEHDKVQRWAIASVFEAYDTLKLRAYLSTEKEFRWCAWSGCGYGQLHAQMDAAPIMTCHKCKRQTCFTHRCEWHENRTCSQYDLDAAKSEEVALLQELENGGKIKKCPKCGQGIEKNDGCDHMTCKKPMGCGHEFCWRCGAPYDGDDGIRKVGNKAHKDTCHYYM